MPFVLRAARRAARFARDVREGRRMRFVFRMRRRVVLFLHDEELKRRLHVYLFEPDTPQGSRFENALLTTIGGMVLVTMLESVRSLPYGVTLALKILEYLFLLAFTAEYLARVYCSRRPVRYIFSFFGIVDMLATVPFYIGLFFPGIRHFLIVRVFRLIRVLHVFKLHSIITEGNLLLVSLRRSVNKILVFFLFVVILVLVVGTIMYIVEGGLDGSSFNNIPNSVYWAIVTMTTVGYGDITPVTPLGRFLSAVTMLLGYTIIAVPTGIVSAQMHSEIHKARSAVLRCPHCGRDGHEKDARYCRHCGHPLERAGKPSGSPAAPDEARPRLQDSGESRNFAYEACGMCRTQSQTKLKSSIMSLKKLNEGAKFTHVSVGDLAGFEGKEFVKDAAGSTSCEISFGTLAEGQAVPFFHSHRANEENYIVLSGSGRFQVDDEAFDIAGGSVVRVATHCDRCIKNTGSGRLLYVCIQARENSLGEYTSGDADLTKRESRL